jgi:hypothetical protein
MKAAGDQFMVFARDGSNSLTGVELQQGDNDLVPIRVGRLGSRSVLTPSDDPRLLDLDPFPLNFSALVHFDLPHPMPESNGQTPHYGDQCDLFLFRIPRYQFLIHSPRLGIVTNVHPTGLA